MAQVMTVTKVFILGLLLALTASDPVHDLVRELELIPHFPLLTGGDVFKDCDEVMNNGKTNSSSTYTIYPYESHSVEAFCDLTTDGGGWTVIQHRDNYIDQQNFYTTWNEYESGFGSASRDYWLGLKNIHALTAQSPQELRIDMEDFEGVKRFALYKVFSVGDHTSFYSLQVNGYQGDAGDALSYHSDMKFSTTDKDNDHSSRNCAEEYKGGWWYNDCYAANLNGVYKRHSYSDDQGIVWKFWRPGYSLEKVTMMIRPA